MAKVGLVLSGAMAKGAYEVGALKAISEYFSPEDIGFISTASVGSLNAYAFSCGKLDYAYDMWRGINKEYPKLFVKTVLMSDYFNNAVSMVSSNDFAAKKLYVSLLNINKRRCDYVNLQGLDRERKIKYLKATMAFAPLVKPVHIGKNYYLDGAFVDNIPVRPLMRHNPDYIICVHFDKYNYTFESELFDERIIKIVFDNDSELLNKSIWVTRDGTEQMLEDGYKKAKRVLKYVFADGTEDIEAVYDHIAVMNSIKPNKQIRLTGDIVVNKISKLTRIITTPKIHN